MRLLGTALLASSIFIYWQIDTEKTGSIGIELQNLNAQVPNYWIILLVIGLGLIFFPKSKSPKHYKPLSRPTRPEYAPSKEQSPESNESTSTTEPEDESTEEEEVEEQSWKTQLKTQALNIELPRGAKIKVDPMKDVPFSLRLERTTPQNTKIALETFANFLNNAPTPKRILIEFVGTMDGGLPKQNLVKFAFQKGLKRQGYIVTTSIEGVDIRFQNASSEWGELCNIERKFS